MRTIKVTFRGKMTVEKHVVVQAADDASDEDVLELASRQLARHPGWAVVQPYDITVINAVTREELKP